MAKSRSEDTVIYSGLTPEITDMVMFYEALRIFFKKKQNIDSSDRFNFILFQDDKPNYLEDFTFNYEHLITALKSLELKNMKTNIASGLFGAIPLFLDVFKKIGDKCYRLIIFIDSGTIEIPKHYIPILEDLIEKINEEMPFFIDVIGINTDNPHEEAKISNLAQRAGGDFHKVKDIHDLENILVLLAPKKEIESTEALDTSDTRALEEMIMFYENIAQNPKRLKIPETCSICFQEDDKGLVQCPICETIVHESCWAHWAKSTDIGIHNIFRCHTCYNLIKLDKEFIYEVQFGTKVYVEEIKMEDFDLEGFLEDIKTYDTPDLVQGEKPKEISEEETITPVSSIELEPEKMKSFVQQYINEKIKTNKKISKLNTIKAVKKSLELDEKDNKWDEDIWNHAIDISKKTCVKTTTKTIVFRL